MRWAGEGEYGSPRVGFRGPAAAGALFAALVVLEVAVLALAFVPDFPRLRPAFFPVLPKAWVTGLRVVLLAPAGVGLGFCLRRPRSLVAVVVLAIGLLSLVRMGRTTLREWDLVLVAWSAFALVGLMSWNTAAAAWATVRFATRVGDDW